MIIFVDNEHESGYEQSWGEMLPEGFTNYASTDVTPIQLKSVFHLR